MEFLSDASLLFDYEAVVLPDSVRHTFTGHTSNVKCVDFVGSDGDLIASGSSDNTVRLWNTHDPEENTVLSGHTSRIWDLDSTKDGGLLASASGDGDVRIWDVKSKDCVGVLQDGRRDVYGVAWHPAGKHLTTGGYDKVVRLWDVERNVVVKTFSGHSSSVSSCMFSPLGNLIITGSKDKYGYVVNGVVRSSFGILLVDYVYGRSQHSAVCVLGW
jgi:COMPASS component SWD3